MSSPEKWIKVEVMCPGRFNSFFAALKEAIGWYIVLGWVFPFSALYLVSKDLGIIMALICYSILAIFLYPKYKKYQGWSPLEVAYMPETKLLLCRTNSDFFEIYPKEVQIWVFVPNIIIAEKMYTVIPPKTFVLRLADSEDAKEICNEIDKEINSSKPWQPPFSFK